MAAFGYIDFEQLQVVDQGLDVREVVAVPDEPHAPPRLVAHRRPEDDVRPLPANAIQRACAVDREQEIVVVHAIAGDGQRQELIECFTRGQVLQQPDEIVLGGRCGERPEALVERALGCPDATGGLPGLFRHALGQLRIADVVAANLSR